MKLLTISAAGRLGRWLAALCDSRPAYRHTSCASIDEALAAIAWTGDFDWIVIESVTSTGNEEIIHRLRQAGCRSPIVQLHFADPDRGEVHPLPTVVCIVENHRTGPRILGCRLAAQTIRAADEALPAIFEYRGPNTEKSAASG